MKKPHFLYFARFLFIYFIKKFKNITNSRYCYTWAAILITSFLQFNFTFLQIGDKKLMNSFYSDHSLDKQCSFFSFYFNLLTKIGFVSQNSSIILNLFGLLIFKLIIIFIGITSPIAGGVFGPFMIMGSILGRIFGEIAHVSFGIENIGRFAIAGAAAISATSTRFLAMTLVVIELTGDLNIVFPIMVTVLFSFATGNLFAKSFFYSTIELRKLPYVPKLMKEEIYNQKVRVIMQKPKIYLHSNSTFFDIFEFLARGKNICLADYIPVTLDLKDMTFVGTVKTENLKNYFMNELKLYKRVAKGSWIKQAHVLLNIYSELDEEVYREKYSSTNGLLYIYIKGYC